MRHNSTELCREKLDIRTERPLTQVFISDYESYFTLTANMNVLTLQLALASLPQQILEDQQILLTVGALKPRTVGAHTAVSISLPTGNQNLMTVFVMPLVFRHTT